MGFWSGKKERYEQVPTLSQGQGGLLEQILGNLGQGGLGGQGYEEAIKNLLGILSGDQSSFDAMEAPARRAFSEKTIPNILERFSGAGARSSSGLQQNLASAGQGLEEGLASQRAGMKSQAVQQLLGNFNQQSSQALGTRGFENVFRPGEPDWKEKLLTALQPGFMKAGEAGGEALMLKLLSLFGIGG